MAEDWNAVAADVAAGIAEAGMAGTIRREIITEIPNPAIPGSGDSETINAACTLVVTEYSLRERESSLIETSDRKALIAAPVTIPARTQVEGNQLVEVAGSANSPALADQLVIGGTVYSIVHVKPLSPAGVVVLFECQVRR